MTEIKETPIDYITERINTKSMFLFYLDKLHIEVNELKRNIFNARNDKSQEINKLKEETSFIKTTTGFQLNVLTDFLFESDINNLKFRHLHLYQDTENRINKIKLSLKKLVYYNSIINNDTKILNKRKEQLVSYKIYAAIIRKFNIKIADKIIEGYTFNMGYNIGIIAIKPKERRTAKINWFESNNRKKELIANGETPYDKRLAPNGVKWLIKFTSDTAYWVYWSKVTCKIPNKLYFSFLPTQGQREYNFVSKLHNYIKDNPLVTLLYENNDI